MGIAYALLVGICGLIGLVWMGGGLGQLSQLLQQPLVWGWAIALFVSQRVWLHMRLTLAISFEEVYLIPVVLALPVEEAAFAILLATSVSLFLGGKWGWCNSGYSYAVLAGTLAVAISLRESFSLAPLDTWLVVPLIWLAVTMFDFIIFGIAVLLSPKFSFAAYLEDMRAPLQVQVLVVLPLAMLATLAASASPAVALALLFLPFLTLRLIGQRLVQAARLESQADARAQAIQVAAHELKTPLTTVAGFAHTLVAQEFAPEQRQQLLQIISSQAQRMQSIIDDLLVYSRLTSSSQDRLHVEPVNVQQVVRQAYEQTASDRPLRLEIPEHIQVLSDRLVLERALVNLFSNANKYAPYGVLRARAHRLEKPSEVAIEIWDEGPGISPEFVPHLFEEFARSDEAQVSGQPGTGLGLAIVRASIRAMGGEATYEDRAHREAGAHGSIFTLRLPTTA